MPLILKKYFCWWVREKRKQIFTGLLSEVSSGKITELFPNESLTYFPDRGLSLAQNIAVWTWGCGLANVWLMLPLLCISSTLFSPPVWCTFTSTCKKKKPIPSLSARPHFTKLKSESQSCNSLDEKKLRYDFLCCLTSFSKQTWLMTEETHIWKIYQSLLLPMWQWRERKKTLFRQRLPKFSTTGYTVCSNVELQPGWRDYHGIIQSNAHCKKHLICPEHKFKHISKVYVP